MNEWVFHTFAYADNFVSLSYYLDVHVCRYMVDFIDMALQYHVFIKIPIDSYSSQ